MKIELLTQTNHPLYTEAMHLYQISFPHHEQREALSQEKILKNPEYRFGLVYDSNCFVGLVLYWETAQFIYIEHLCILPEKRNNRYGERVLAILKDKHKTLILEIDPPIDELSKRRKGFYERCGFIENPFPHIHPPYHKEDSGHKLRIMTNPEPLSQIDYDSFYRYLRDKVMDHAF